MTIRPRNGSRRPPPARRGRRLVPSDSLDSDGPRPTEHTMPSPRPKWMRTTNGWRWGRYQIERLAPRMWVLTQLGNDPQSTPTIVTTAASLRALKHMAEWREARYTRRRVMWMHGLVALVAAVGLGAVTFLPPPGRDRVDPRPAVRDASFRGDRCRGGHQRRLGTSQAHISVTHGVVTV